MPGTTSESSEPATAAGTPTTRIQAPRARDRSPRGGSAAIPRSTTAGSTAASSRSPAIGVAPSARIAGVETTAPPTPNMPESMPVSEPGDEHEDQRLEPGIATRTPERYQGAPRTTLIVMASDLDLRGVWVPLITPFAADGAVDLDAIERLCHEYLDAGVSGIVALGTTGEASALDADEKRAVIDAVRAVCSDDTRQLIVGTGIEQHRARPSRRREALAGTPALAARSSWCRTTCARPRPASSRTSTRWRPRARCRSSLYNIPARTGRDLSAAGVLELAAHPEHRRASSRPSPALDADTLEVLADAPAGFGVLGGEDPFLFPLMLHGRQSARSPRAAHVCTERFVAMIECGLAGKLDDGRAHAEALLPVVQARFAEPNPAVFKGVLHAQGRIPTADVRLPLVNASDARSRRRSRANAAPDRPIDRAARRGSSRSVTNGCASESSGVRLDPPAAREGAVIVSLSERVQEQAYQRRWLILGVLCFSLLVIVVDNSILNVAHPDLSRDLHASNSELQWMVDCYTLVFAGLLLTAGSLGDRFGRRGALQIGLTVFGIGSLLSALRGLRHTAHRHPRAHGHRRRVHHAGDAVDHHQRVPDRGAGSGDRRAGPAVAGIGIALGPITGGFLLEHFYWGSIFLVNLPIVVVRPRSRASS